MDSIAALEREIEQFKNNIANSNQLVSNLQDVTTALKEHNSNVNTLAAELSNNVPQKLMEISATSYAKSYSELNDAFDSKMAELIAIQKNINHNISELETFTKEVSEVIIQTNNNVCESIRKEISSELKEYPYNNKQYIDKLIDSLKNAEAQTNQFIEKITFMNDDILKNIQKLSEDKTIENQIQKQNDNFKNKFIPIYGCTALIIVLFIIQFFI